MNVAELINEGLVSKDIADLVFSTDEYEQEDRLDDTSLIPTSYKVCSIYLALMHARVVGEGVYRGTTVDLLGYKSISSWILNFWDTGSPGAFNEKSILSTLIVSASDDSCRSFFGPSAVQCLCKVRDAYSIYADPNAKQKVNLRQISVDEFKELLRSLPLLRSTRIDSKKFDFIFSLADQTEFSIKCYPFVGYWDAESARTSSTDTPKQKGDDPLSCYVLVGVRNGPNNSTIRTEIMVLDETRNFETGKRSTKLVQYSSNNEYIRMVCNAVKHPIEWITIDDSICDLAFVKTLATTVSDSLIEFWDSYPEFLTIGTASVAGSLKKMFESSPELYEAIDSDSYIAESDLINSFYGLFIQHGILKTMYALFLDSEKDSYGDKLFEIYVRHMGNITDESREIYKAECIRNIECHLLKLKTIIPESSPLAFASRARGIRAECRAQCALKAAGLCADKLFVEQEEIRSIDNFYYMIKNSSTQLIDDLKNVLIMLISFYNAILSANIPFSDRQFHMDMWKTKERIVHLPVLDLLDELKKTVIASQGNEMLEHYIGRSHICNPQMLEGYIKSLRAWIPMLQQTASHNQGTMPQVFISYSHKDLPLVKRYTEHFKKSDIPIYIDETEFHTGDRWYPKAKDFIYSDNCKAVVVFLSKNSVESKAVAKELGAASSAAMERIKDPIARERFIIPINLEHENVEVYLHKKLDRPDDEKRNGFSAETRPYAEKIADTITIDKICKSVDDWDIGNLEQEIKDRLNIQFDGVLVESQRPYNELEFAVASLYAFLKFGDEFQGSTPQTIDRDFTTLPISGKSCIFPLVTSVKETRIKRDNITLMGYEIVGNNGLEDSRINYILSSRSLPPDDYYCLPNSRTTAKDCAWMVEPLLINSNLFIKTPEENII